MCKWEIIYILHSENEAYFYDFHTIRGNEAQERLWGECIYLYIRVAVDEWLRHLQCQILVLPPVEHEHDTLLPDDLTQREICASEGHSEEFRTAF